MSSLRFPKALRCYPLFCRRHGPAMIHHKFQGSWGSLVGLECCRASSTRRPFSMKTVGTVALYLDGRLVETLRG